MENLNFTNITNFIKLFIAIHNRLVYHHAPLILRLHRLAAFSVVTISHALGRDTQIYRSMGFSKTEKREQTGLKYLQ